MIAPLEQLDVSVILATYNPRGDVLRRTLACLGRQSLPQDRWELIVVDNNSSPALVERELCTAAGRPVQLVREPRQGTLPARASGIKAAGADLLVFVDDDNFLYPEYLQTALEIAEANPRFGAFGGRTEGIYERRLLDWHRPVLEYLAVRDFGEEPIESESLEWGRWEPIGAGMVARRDGMQYYLNLADSEKLRENIGRRGNVLLSCGDSLLAKSAIKAGYSNSYQPRLRLKHFIRHERFRPAYLRRLIAGMGQSLVKLTDMLQLPSKEASVPDAKIGEFLRGNAHYELTENGRGGALLFYWSFGVLTESLRLDPHVAMEVFAEARHRLRRQRSAAERTPLHQCDNPPPAARQQAETLIRKAAELLPLPAPGAPSIPHEKTVLAACRLVQEAALLTTGEPPDTPLAWEARGGLKTLFDDGKPMLHFGCGPRSVLTVPSASTQQATLLVEARPLRADVAVDFLLNGSLVHAEQLQHADGNRRLLVPLDLNSGENELTIEYACPEVQKDRPAVLFWLLGVVPECHWSPPESLTRLRDEEPQFAASTPPRVAPMPVGGTEFQRISMVIPNYNSGRTLERAVQSLLSQEYPELEIILIDGGSTDDSLRVIDKYADRLSFVLSEPDQGQADAINKGFRLANGTIRGWLCADDELLPQALHSVNHLFLMNAECAVLTGGCERIYADGQREITRPPTDPWRVLGMRLLLEQPSTFWRAALHERVGELETGYRLTFDWDLWARFRAAGARLMVTPKPLSRYHFSDDNKTSAAGNLHAHEHLRVIRQYGPQEGLVADCFQLLYHFDLQGCLDREPPRDPSLAHTFWTLRNTLGALIGQDNLAQYNLHFASLQERGMVWWK